MVVSLEEDESSSNGNNQLRLEDFEDTILMNIFAFLDALEILNTAQINTSMYNRVDALFGLGDGATDNTTIATEEEGSTTATTTVPPTTTTTTAASVHRRADDSSPATAAAGTTEHERKPRSSSTGDAPSAASSTTTPVTPTRDNQHKTSLPAGTTSTTTTTTTSTQQQAAAVMNNVFQMFQPRRGTSTTAGSPSRRTTTGTTPLMNAATASAVAAKLTDTELNAILSMMERMRSKEAAVEKLKVENEQLRAAHEGTQAVKDFLIQKVRAMEESLTAQEENETKVAQQIASDQEVIAFLDARVQALEWQVQNLQQARADLEKEKTTLRNNLEQRTAVLQDMLQFERERFVEFEKDAKGTKKVLVKEIKLCRNQITALTAERDALQEQNQTLQSAVLHTPGGSGGGGGGGGGLGERIYA